MRYFLHKGLFIPMVNDPGWPRTKKRRLFKKRLKKRVTFPEPGKIAWYAILRWGPVFVPDKPIFINIGT